MSTRRRLPRRILVGAGIAATVGFGVVVAASAQDVSSSPNPPAERTRRPPEAGSTPADPLNAPAPGDSGRTVLGSGPEGWTLTASFGGGNSGQLCVNVELPSGAGSGGLCAEPRYLEAVTLVRVEPADGGQGYIVGVTRGAAQEIRASGVAGMQSARTLHHPQFGGFSFFILPASGGIDNLVALGQNGEIVARGSSQALRATK